MNTLDVMKYGHLTVLGSVNDLEEQYWSEDGVCGVWSVKDIIAHLASYELVLGDILVAITGGTHTPHLDEYLSVGSRFNDEAVESRRGKTETETLGEYVAAHERVTLLAADVPQNTWLANGTIPWYGDEYSLDDFIVYQYYGHKREHCAQVAVYRDLLASREESGLNVN
jgi:hypothetical protein